MRREELRSLWLGHAVARALVADPDRVRGLARVNIAKLRAAHASTRVLEHLNEWEALLDRPLEDLLDVLVDTSEHAVDLRQDSPFAGTLTPAERHAVLAAFRAVHPGGAASALPALRARHDPPRATAARAAP